MPQVSSRFGSFQGDDSFYFVHCPTNSDQPAKRHESRKVYYAAIGLPESIEAMSVR